MPRFSNRPLEEALLNLIRDCPPASPSESDGFSVLSQTLENVLDIVRRDFPPDSPSQTESLLEALRHEISLLNSRPTSNSAPEMIQTPPQILSPNPDRTAVFINALHNSLSALRNPLAAEQQITQDNQETLQNTPNPDQDVGLNLFGILDDALSALRNLTPPPAPPHPPPQPSSVTPLPHHRQAVQFGSGIQPPPSPESAHPRAPAPPSSPVPGPSSDRGEHERSRERFNNHELRRRLMIPASVDPPSLVGFYTSVMSVLAELADRTASLTERNDFVQIELSGPSLSHHLAFNRGEDDGEILQQFESFLDQLVQSNGEAYADGSVEFTVQIVKNQRGGGGNKRRADRTLDIELLSKKRRHLYIVENDEKNLCFSISLAHVCNPTFTDAEALKTALEWQSQVGPAAHTPVTLSDVCRFEKLLNRKIVVFYRASSDTAISKFETDFSDRSRTVFLFLLNNHFYGVKNIKSFLGVQYFCYYCFTPFQNLHTHNCGGSCGVCNDPSCAQQESDLILCSSCNRTCRNRACFQSHQVPKERPVGKQFVSNCQLYKRCLGCKQIYRVPLTGNGETHKCARAKCTICRQKLDPGCDVIRGNHLCYIQHLPRDKELNDKLIFYDFETFLNSEKVHVPFLVCTKSVLGRTWASFGLDCVRDFLLKFRTRQFKHYTFIAHNARSFDSYLILNTMTELGMSPSIIMQGSKVLCFTDPHYNLKFLDSLSFLSMKLSAFPNALGFPDSAKGYFPHKFSSLEHLKYAGPFPAASYYDADKMSPPELEKFNAWYAEASRKPFHFEKEAIFYCRNDVDILYQGCLKFRRQFFDETRIDPFKQITIASACMKVFQSNFLKADTLAIPSPTNYIHSKTYSNMSIQWLEWLSHSRKINIQHALNVGEKRVGRYSLDGYSKMNGVNLAFEFMGCFFHGCPKCFTPQEKCQIRGLCFEEIYRVANEKLLALKNVHKFQIEAIWEHEWEEMKKSSSELREFLQNYEAPEPLHPRHALYGGRTCAVRLRFTPLPEETVQYVDFCSLYPSVNAEGVYPVGHPRIIYRDFDEPQNYFGFIRAVVEPPRKLYFPVLPFKTSHGKLVFTLCRTCAETNNQQTPCSHNAEQRALTGVWVTEEFNEALKFGYKVLKITQVWHFEQRSDSLFIDYIKTFLKNKQESSGFPPEATDEESKQKYIEDYLTHQGVQLDRERIQWNPARRQVAKLCLNSFWGKFAQRNDLTHTCIVKEPDQLFDYLFSGKYKVTYFHFLNSVSVLIQWTYNKRCITPPNKTNNVFIAAFTTALARLKLLKPLQQLKENVLYMDTDSLIYVVKHGDKPLELGHYLGQLTSELDHGDSIQDFVAAGPKSYAYKTRRGKVLLRVKGITQTYESCSKVNFDGVRELVEGYLAGGEDAQVEVPQQNIKRDKRGFYLKTSSFQKRFKVVYDKRRLFSDGTTLPFGF